MKSKHTTTAELPGSIAQAFNLAGQESNDGWRDAKGCRMVKV